VVRDISPATVELWPGEFFDRATPFAPAVSALAQMAFLFSPVAPFVNTKL
jgi:hypothetical protein